MAAATIAPVLAKGAGSLLLVLLKPFAYITAAIIGVKEFPAMLDSLLGKEKKAEELTEKEIANIAGTAVGFIGGVFLASLIFRRK